MKKDLSYKGQPPEKEMRIPLGQVEDNSERENSQKDIQIPQTLQRVNETLNELQEGNKVNSKKCISGFKRMLSFTGQPLSLVTQRSTLKKQNTINFGNSSKYPQNSTKQNTPLSRQNTIGRFSSFSLENIQMSNGANTPSGFKGGLSRWAKAPNELGNGSNTPSRQNLIERNNFGAFEEDQEQLNQPNICQKQENKEYMDPRYEKFVKLLEDRDPFSEPTLDEIELVSGVLGDFRHFRILVRPQARIECARKLLKHLQIGRKERGEFYFHRGETSKNDLVCILNGKVGVYGIKPENYINMEMDLLGKIHSLNTQANKLEKQAGVLSSDAEKFVHQLRQRCEMAEEELEKLRNKGEDELLRKNNSAKYFKTENICSYKREKYEEHGSTLGEEQVVNGGICLTTTVCVTQVVYFFIKSSAYREIFSLQISKNSFVCAALRANFPGAKDDSLRRVSYDFKEEIYDYNKIIFDQGEAAHLVMLVRSGEVEALREIVIDNSIANIKKQQQIDERTGVVATDVNQQDHMNESFEKINQKDKEGKINDKVSNDSDVNQPELLIKKKRRKQVKEINLGIIGEGQLLGIEDVYGIKKTRSFKAVSKQNETVIYYINKKELDDVIVLNEDYAFKRELKIQSKNKIQYYDQRAEELLSFQSLSKLIPSNSNSFGATEKVDNDNNNKQFYEQFEKECDKIQNSKQSQFHQTSSFSYSRQSSRAVKSSTNICKLIMTPKSEMNFLNQPGEAQKDSEQQLLAPVELNPNEQKDFEDTRRKLLKFRNLVKESRKHYRLKSDNSFLTSILKKTSTMKLDFDFAQPTSNNKHFKKDVITISPCISSLQIIPQPPSPIEEKHVPKTHQEFDQKQEKGTDVMSFTKKVGEYPTQFSISEFQKTNLQSEESPLVSRQPQKNRFNPVSFQNMYSSSLNSSSQIQQQILDNQTQKQLLCVNQPYLQSTSTSRTFLSFTNSFNKDKNSKTSIQQKSNNLIEASQLSLSLNVQKIEGISNKQNNGAVQTPEISSTTPKTTTTNCLHSQYSKQSSMLLNYISSGFKSPRFTYNSKNSISFPSKQPQQQINQQVSQQNLKVQKSLIIKDNPSGINKQTSVPDFDSNLIQTNQLRSLQQHNPLSQISPLLNLRSPVKPINCSMDLTLLNRGQSPPQNTLSSPIHLGTPQNNGGISSFNSQTTRGTLCNSTISQGFSLSRKQSAPNLLMETLIEDEERKKFLKNVCQVKSKSARPLGRVLGSQRIQNTNKQQQMYLQTKICMQRKSQGALEVLSPSNKSQGSQVQLQNCSINDITPKIQFSIFKEGYKKNKRKSDGISAINPKSSLNSQQQSLERSSLPPQQQQLQPQGKFPNQSPLRISKNTFFSK